MGDPIPVAPVPWYTSQTIITALVGLAVAVLGIVGVPVTDVSAEKIIIGVMALGYVYVWIRRMQATPSKPLTQAQSAQLTADAIQITGV
jgi:hypothetical protein